MLHVATKESNTAINERVQKRKKNLQKNGLRPVQIWVPDTRREGFAKECARQSALLKADPGEKDILQFMEVADRDGWTA
jgi:hypothetical protein